MMSLHRVSATFSNTHIHALCIGLFFFPAVAGAQIKTVWALGDGEKVFRDDTAHRDKKSNAVWDGKTIRLKGLYNEVLQFQVIVETGVDTATGVEVAVTAPVHKGSGKVLGGTTLKYGPQGAIEIFTEHYLQVKDSTPPNWFYGSPAAAPKKMTGWIPDALIPADAVPGRGGFPVAVAPNRNQGFWVDVHLPRDQKQFPAGSYTGSVQVYEEGKLMAEIPLEVTVLPHYLPDENVNNVWLFASALYDYFPGLPHQQVETMLKWEAHRHRIDAVGGFNVNTAPFSTEKMQAYKPYLDGTAFTPAQGYHGAGEGVGERLFPIGMYAAPVMGNSKSAVQQQSDLWVDWFQKNAPQATYFWYSIDEPREDKWAWIKERSAWIKSGSGVGKALPVFTTTAYHKDLSGAIDMWAGYDGVDLAVLPEIRKSGGDHWFYNGNRPRYGSVILEGAAVDFRVNSWILYKYGIKTWFIWEGTHWQHNGQGPKGNLHQNIFKNPLTFINSNLEYGNGDGILFYPGRMPFYPDEDRGLNRLLPSIRLKNIRRGQQDAALMALVEKKVGRDAVLRIISRVVPKALSEVSMKDAVPWSERGDDYEKARTELLKLL